MMPTRQVYEWKLIHHMNMPAYFYSLQKKNIM